ncbi:HAMP domain-containing histidine kinase [Cnuibacter physcomitrellae]|uniref:sensor histidine kinase n=1 Tax=Cnuibacter physcomitrellae TaxID=1619308 RepID=UPI002175D80F|nr:HAMP domain-containing histidine kinase [Cnuibacter physcomitrellae]MCS5496000.1 HAMP domain-containing histidine kinase [Cnuibacter physcomitrellae]
MTLRRTLILSVLGLIALAGVIIGVTSTLVLNDFLVDRLDSQLSDSAARTEQFIRGQDGNGGPAPGIPLGQGEGTLAAIAAGGVVDNGLVLTADGRYQYLSAPQLAALDATISSVDAESVDIPGIGEYRVLSRTIVGDSAVIIGLPLDDVNATVTQLVIVIVIVTAAAMVVAGLIGLIVVRLSTRPLERMAATASRVARMRLDRGEVALAERVPSRDTDTRTEVGRVGAALNGMLEHVAAALTSRQRSENKVRQFVADASHELRTPLASIRGYAELTRRADVELPDDIRYSLGRIESEATRMTTLVEDLLLLARLDSRPELAMTDVDLSLVLVDAVSDAHAAGPDHHWDLDLPEEPLEVSADRHRLHQVFANLLANARVHTPPGTTVTVAAREGRADDGSRHAVVTVGDDGPGIEPDMLPTLFERFVRGDASRSRHAGSTGLGLAIVKAVTEAHEGTVSVESAPGSTVFTLTLPLAGDHSTPVEQSGRPLAEGDGPA